MNKWLISMVLLFSLLTFPLTTNTISVSIEKKYSLKAESSAYGSIGLNSELALVNVTLKNGTVISFETVDAAIRFLFDNLKGEKLRKEDIVNVTTMRFSDYLDVVNGKKNLSDVNLLPSYKLFYLKKEGVENYEGKYIPVGEHEAFLDKLDILERSLIYWRIDEIKLKDINSNTHSLDNLENANFSLLVFVNSSNEEIFNNTINVVKKNITLIENLSVKIFVVDVANNLETMRRASESINSTIVFFVLDSNATISGKTIPSLFRELGFNRITPSIAIISYDGLLLDKSFGLEDFSYLTKKIKTLEIFPEGTVKRILKEVYLEKPVAGKTTDLVIVFSGGFSEILSLKGEYNFVYENGSVSVSRSITFSSTDGRVFRHTIQLPNNTIQLNLNLTIETSFYNETLHNSIPITFKGEKTGTRGIPLEYWLIVLVSLFLIAIVGYRVIKK